MDADRAVAPEAVGSPWRQLLGASRPLSWVNTAYPFGAAYLLTGGGLDLAFWVGVAYFLVPYNLLMYGVNDVFDYDSDLLNPRKGGVEGVVLLNRWHRLALWAAVASNIPFLVVLVAVGTPGATIALAVVVFAVVAYSAPRLRFKERPLLDSVTSSTHFTGPAVFGFLLAHESVSPAVTQPVSATALAAFTAFFLWGAASHAFGAVQDIPADKGAGISSVATWFGGAATVRLAVGCYAAAALLLLFGTPWPARLAGLLAVPYLLNVWPYRSVTERDCESAHAGWRRFLVLNYVTGFLLTQLLIWVTLRR
jgi:4-hydroxybenzoate polyprenyltransferase